MIIGDVHHRSQPALMRTTTVRHVGTDGTPSRPAVVHNERNRQTTLTTRYGTLHTAGRAYIARLCVVTRQPTTRASPAAVGHLSQVPPPPCTPTTRPSWHTPLLHRRSGQLNSKRRRLVPYPGLRQRYATATMRGGMP